jgi:hypothetical protein
MVGSKLRDHPEVMSSGSWIYAGVDGSKSIHNADTDLVYTGRQTAGFVRLEAALAERNARAKLPHHSLGKRRTGGLSCDEILEWIGDCVFHRITSRQTVHED